MTCHSADSRSRPCPWADWRSCRLSGPPAFARRIQRVLGTGNYQVPIALVKFDDYTGESFMPAEPRVVPIVPATCSVRHSGVTYVREQLPLIPAEGVTILVTSGGS